MLFLLVDLRMVCFYVILLKIESQILEDSISSDYTDIVEFRMERDLV